MGTVVRNGARLGWLYIVFLLSGAAALIYQLAWQRALYAIYGIDITSVTIVVTAFMLGLGLGSLLGGQLSRVAPGRAIALFAGFEFGIGLFGFFSLDIFAWVGTATLGIGHLATGLVAFGLVLLPTLLMGATLPLLVGYVAQRRGSIGRSVGSLYFANTLGAAVGALLTAGFLFGFAGLTASTRVAALANFLLASFLLVLDRRERDRS